MDTPVLANFQKFIFPALCGHRVSCRETYQSEQTKRERERERDREKFILSAHLFFIVILDGTVCISLHANTLGKRMNLIILPPTMNK